MSVAPNNFTFIPITLHNTITFLHTSNMQSVCTSSAFFHLLLYSSWQTPTHIKLRFLNRVSGCGFQVRPVFTMMMIPRRQAHKLYVQAERRVRAPGLRGLHNACGLPFTQEDCPPWPTILDRLHAPAHQITHNFKAARERAFILSFMFRNIHCSSWTNLID